MNKLLLIISLLFLTALVCATRASAFTESCGESVKLPGDQFITGITALPGGGFAAAGVTETGRSHDTNFLLLGLDRRGGIEWRNTWGNEGSHEIASSIAPDGMNGFAVAGTRFASVATAVAEDRSFAEPVVVFFNTRGGETWRVMPGDLLREGEALSLRPDGAGGWLVSGKANRQILTGTDAWAARLDADGEEMWSSTIPGSGGVGEVRATRMSCDGKAVIAAGADAVFASESSRDVWLAALDPATGELLWEQTYGRPIVDEAAVAIAAAPGGGIVAAGVTQGFTDREGTHNLYVLAVDSGGKELWEYEYGDSGSDEFASSVEPSGDGGYIIAGAENSGDGYDALVIKLDSGGNEVWRKTFGGDGNDAALALAPANGGGYIAAGYITPDSGGRDAWAFMIDEEGNCKGGFGF